MFRYVCRLSKNKQPKLICLLLYCFGVYVPLYAVAQSNLQSTRPIIFTKPIELDWHSLKWPSVDYQRVAVPGGAAIYSLPNDTALKFDINFVFPRGVYAIAREDRTAFSALSDLLMLGGFGNLNFDEIQNYVTQYGIDIKSSLSSEGNLTITAEALTVDFKRTIDLLTDLILAPRFDKPALPLWKQQAINIFQNLLNGNTFEKQYRFIDREAIVLAFGNDHYFSTALQRISPAAVNKVTDEQVKKLYKDVISRNGLNVSIAGNFLQRDLNSLKNLVAKIPELDPVAQTWLPGRDLETSAAGIVEKEPHKIRTVIIAKPDMTQCNVSLRYYFPYLGKLNPIEITQHEILGEIFSSSGGVVGNDRFSKVLRANSGLSYSPHAGFIDKVVYPNTDVAMMNLSFQSPNERIAEAVYLAIATWDTFLEKGVTKEELENTRTAMMNRMLAKESTVFDKADMFMSSINQGLLPDVNPTEMSLVKLNQQRDLKNLNNALSHFSQEAIYPVLVIMGNPSQEQIEQLKKLENVELVSIKNWDEVAKF